MARKRLGEHCKNRDIVNVGNQLFSPDYDFEGDDEGTWYEYAFGAFTFNRPSRIAMCSFGVCMGGDIERWKVATGRYIEKEFKPQLAKTRKIIAAYSQNAPPTMEQQDVLNRAEKLIKDWKEFQDLEEPSAFWMNEITGYIHSIVRIFDRAACLMDELNDLADDMGASHLANRAPILEPKSAPDGGSWIRGGAGGGDGLAPTTGLGVVGWIALGAAGYFGFKVLTE